MSKKLFREGRLLPFAQRTIPAVAHDLATTGAERSLELVETDPESPALDSRESLVDRTLGESRDGLSKPRARRAGGPVDGESRRQAVEERQLGSVAVEVHQAVGRIGDQQESTRAQNFPADLQGLDPLLHGLVFEQRIEEDQFGPLRQRRRQPLEQDLARVRAEDHVLAETHVVDPEHPHPRFGGAQVLWLHVVGDDLVTAGSQSSGDRAGSAADLQHARGGEVQMRLDPGQNVALSAKVATEDVVVDLAPGAVRAEPLGGTPDQVVLLQRIAKFALLRLAEQRTTFDGGRGAA